MKKIFLSFLVLVILPSVVLGADHFYAVSSYFLPGTPSRRCGFVRRDYTPALPSCTGGCNVYPCSLEAPAAVAPQDVKAYRRYQGGTPYHTVEQGWLGFPVVKAGAGEIVKSALLRLTLRDRADSNDVQTNVLLSYCNGCAGALPLTIQILASDWYESTTYFRTIYWDSLPSPLDSMFISIPVGLFTTSAADTIDFRFETDQFDDWCTMGLGVDAVAFVGAQEDSTWMRPVLYVWTMDAEECTETGRVWFNSSDGYMYYCDGAFIRRLYSVIP